VDTWTEALQIVERAIQAARSGQQAEIPHGWLDLPLGKILQSPWSLPLFARLVIHALAERDSGLWVMAEAQFGPAALGNLVVRDAVSRVQSLLQASPTSKVFVPGGLYEVGNLSGTELVENFPFLTSELDLGSAPSLKRVPMETVSFETTENLVADVSIEESAGELLPGLSRVSARRLPWLKQGLSRLGLRRELFGLGNRYAAAKPIEFSAPVLSAGPRAEIKVGAENASVSGTFNKPAEWPGSTVVRVFYATDRLPIAGLNRDVTYDGRRSLMGKLHYGKCEISIPKGHETGKLESPSILRLEFRPDRSKHIVLVKTQNLEEQLFFDELKASVGSSPAKDAFVFVHGYNVSFEDAARRTGQIAFDLKFDGAPVFYSWPSNASKKDYLVDETNVFWSAPHFERFLLLLSQNSGAERIHILAHSMGNRAIFEALKSLSRQPDIPIRFSHLLLAAPDIDAETFEELANTLKELSGHITLYESSKDKALLASKLIHGNRRAGEPLLVIPGMDTIDVSAIDTDFLGHSYFSDTWPLLSDIHSIIAKNEQPSSRFGLTEMQNPVGKYYVFRP
jgi:esterase/lipase superfamily enzyme